MEDHFEIASNNYGKIEIFGKLAFWFNQNPSLAIPLVAIPTMPHNGNKSIRAQNRKINRERVAHKKKRIGAVNVIERWWQTVLAKRTLKRLRFMNEIHLLPRVGILYEHALQHFTSLGDFTS
jgi:hypothetical protein